MWISISYYKFFTFCFIFRIKSESAWGSERKLQGRVWCSSPMVTFLHLWQCQEPHSAPHATRVSLQRRLSAALVSNTLVIPPLSHHYALYSERQLDERSSESCYFIVSMTIKLETQTSEQSSLYVHWVMRHLYLGFLVFGSFLLTELDFKRRETGGVF